jgi:hypothetical protein
MSRFLAHLGREPAALDHEVRNDAMKDRPIVESFLDILQEVLHADRRTLLVQLHRDVAHRRLDDDDWVFLCVSAGRQRSRGDDDTNNSYS